MSKITNKMKEFIKDNKDLLQINPTEFLISAESNDMYTFDISDIDSFIEMFDKSSIEFDINKLFDSPNWNFIDKYIKKGASQEEIESLFYDEILKNPTLDNIVTEIPPYLFENLSNDDIHSAIKNSMLCYKIGSIQGQVERIFVQAFLDVSKCSISISVKVKSAQHVFYNYAEVMGVWIPKYGFMINKTNFFEKIKEISNSLQDSLKLVNGDQ